MSFICELCNVKFLSEVSLRNHYNTKRHKINNNVEVNYTCDCGKSFTRQPNLSRHKRLCKLQPMCTEGAQQPLVFNQLVFQNKMIAEQNKLLKKDNEKLKKQISLLLDKNMSNNTHNDHSTNTTNHNNTTNNIETQNVIVVNSFGSENTEYLTDRIVSRLIQNGPFTCLPKIIEKIHFDPEHPENHNIKVTNQKNNYAKIIKDNKWVTTNKKQAIEKMIQNGYDILEEKYQDNKEAMNDFKKERFENFQHKYENNNKELMRTMRDEVDITLINGTDKIHR